MNSTFLDGTQSVKEEIDKSIGESCRSRHDYDGR